MGTLASTCPSPSKSVQQGARKKEPLVTLSSNFTTAHGEGKAQGQVLMFPLPVASEVPRDPTFHLPVNVSYSFLEKKKSRAGIQPCQGGTIHFWEGHTGGGPSPCPPGLALPTTSSFQLLET